jgi:hypothetical protein
VSEAYDTACATQTIIAYDGLDSYLQDGEIKTGIDMKWDDESDTTTIWATEEGECVPLYENFVVYSEPGHCHITSWKLGRFNETNFSEFTVADTHGDDIDFAKHFGYFEDWDSTDP